MRTISPPADAASKADSRPSAGEAAPALQLGRMVRPHHVTACAALAALYLIASYVPLRATDLWSHVLFGQWILEHGRPPTTDPTQWLAEGMPVIDSAWLSQVVLATVERLGGAVGLSSLFALLTIFTVWMWGRVYYLRTRRFGAAFVATALMLVFGFSRLTTLRPETFAAACFAILVWLLSRADCRRERILEPNDSEHGFSAPFSMDAPLSPPRGRSLLWVALPLVMAVWANMHGSFVVGVIVVACATLGHAIQRFYTTGRLRTLWSDRELQRWILLSELCVAATLLNPYGWRLLVHVVGFSSHPSIATITEWQPLTILGTAGREFALSWLLLMLAWRRSRRPIHPTMILLLAATAWATVHQIRMIAWYAPIAGLALAPHLRALLPMAWSDAVASRARRPIPGQSAATRWWPTLAGALVVWTALAWSPMGQSLLGQKTVRPPERLYGSDTPLAVTQYLNEQPPDGPVFNPQWWGDWLVWRGPQGLKVFATSQMHLLPPHVWNDYRRVAEAAPGWQATLDRYGISTVLVDQAHQPRLASAMQQDDSWQLVYEDDQARVYRRRRSDAWGKTPVLGIHNRRAVPQDDQVHQIDATERSASNFDSLQEV